jgi:hypothetical protein
VVKHPAAIGGPLAESQSPKVGVIAQLRLTTL